MKVFVTGATGFIGSHLVPKLIARGYAVTCLVRDPRRVESLALAQPGATLAVGDVTDRESMREPMRDSEAVVHLAGWYAYGIRDKQRMQAINVEGARHTSELAVELGVPKILFTSTLAIAGNTRGRVVDESYRVEKQELTSEYERTKWAAHYEVAVPLQQRGAPIIFVQPGVVIGPGDPSQITTYYAIFFRRMPVMFGAKSGVTWAHVNDIAEGHVLALEKGRIGESYILAGPPLTYKEAMQMWEKITSVPAPKAWISGWAAGGLSRLVGLMERAFGLNMATSSEGLRTQADYTFFGSAQKAKRELGWQPRPVEEAFRETLEDWQKRHKKEQATSDQSVK